MLHHCPFCNENSIVNKSYFSRELDRRLDYKVCMNKGCNGKKQDSKEHYKGIHKRQDKINDLS